MDSYDKFLKDAGCWNIKYRDVKDADQQELNDYINILIYTWEYVNGIDVFTDMWLSTVQEYEYGCYHGSCVVNGTTYYFNIYNGD